MNYTYVSSLFILILCSNCGTMRPEDVIGSAERDYRLFMQRYRDLLPAFDEGSPQVLAAARMLSSEESLSFGETFGAYVCGNEHLVASQSTPLQRALVFIERDITLLARHRRQLERKASYDVDVYEDIQELIIDLTKVARVLRGTKEFTQESQFADKQRMSRQQLSEQRSQTRLLQDIAERPASVTEKTVYNKTVVVIE